MLGISSRYVSIYLACFFRLLHREIGPRGGRNAGLRALAPPPIKLWGEAHVAEKVTEDHWTELDTE